jgi:ketosteroid isomerase-like protein
MSAANLEMAREGLRAFNDRDVEWLIANSTPDCEWYPAVAGGVQPEPYRGEEGLRKFWQEHQEVWEEFVLEAEEIRDLNNHVLVFGHVRAKGRAGVAFEHSLDALWEVRDGKFLKGRSYLDRKEALRAAAEASGQEVAL